MSDRFLAHLGIQKKEKQTFWIWFWCKTSYNGQNFTKLLPILTEGFLAHLSKALHSNYFLLKQFKIYFVRK